MLNIKTLIITGFGLLSQLYANAQKDTLMYYLDKTGNYLSDKTGAEYMRFVIREDKNKYRTVEDFYSNGKLKMVTQSLNDDGHDFIGPQITYSKNGKRLMYGVIEKDGFLKSYIIYYPNGKKAIIGHYDYNSPGAFIDEISDTTGTVLATKGNGQGVFYYGKMDTSLLPVSMEYATVWESDDYSNWAWLKESGPIKKGKKTGLWYMVKKTDTIAKINYNHGVVTSGIGYNSFKIPYTFTRVYEPADFKDDYYTLIDYITSKLDLKLLRKNNDSGWIELGFDVETDGSIDNISLMQSVGYGLDEQAINALKATSNHWNPLKQFGIAEKVHKTCSIFLK